VALFNGVYEVRNQITCSGFNLKLYFALKFYSFHALGIGRTMTAITRQHVTYFLNPYNADRALPNYSQESRGYRVVAWVKRQIVWF